MKAIDIATSNHVSEEDVMTICQDLGIPCGDKDFDLSDKDVFLIEKKIEKIKEERAKETRELLSNKQDKSDKKGTKIKLKRKVHVSKELKKEKQDEDQNKNKSEAVKEKSVETAAKGAQEKDKAREGKAKERKTGQQTETSGYKGKRDQKAVSKPERKEDGRRRAGEKSTAKTPDESKIDKGITPPIADVDNKKKEESELVVEKEKRKKTKEKDKERDVRKKLYREKSLESEKDIALRKKKSQGQQEIGNKPVVTPKKIEIIESITVGDLAKKLNVKANEVIARLMKLGMMATINQVLDAETAEILASDFGTEVSVVSLFEETVIRQEDVDKLEDRIKRPPIVTVMGHVDHGKTKLLDAIRESNVIDKEHGGITQHIGAYMVKVGDEYVSFLDTPGHEAFTTMRARGTGVTDIVILVVAANDGVMPQTVEAINHAKDADVPIIVAINKIDLPDVNVQKVKQDLSNYELAPEEWGGTTLFSEISAKQKINIDGLLELVLIQAEMLELKANPKVYARGTVIESRIDPGRGVVATILVQNGTLKNGDPFVVGIYQGKVRSMYNDQGVQITEAGPSTPVEVLGLSGVPSAGDPFQVVESEKYSKQISQKRLELKRIEEARKVKKVTLEDLNDMIKEGDIQELRIIIKADVDGSVQALHESLEKLSTGEVRVKVIHSGAGGINESDVMLASASNAIIIGYHVRPTAKVTEIADKEKVSIQFYNVIFEATNDVRAALEGMLSPELKEEIAGTGEIKQIFKISKIGTVAGAILQTGKIQRKNKLRLIRDGIVIFDGELKSLKRFKDDIGEVEAGQEFGFSLDNYNDIKEGDAFEAYTILEVSKTLESRD